MSTSTPPVKRRTYGMFVHGRLQSCESSDIIPIRNPVSDEIIATVTNANAADVDLAVSSARNACQAWAATTQQTRSRILRNMAELVRQNLDRLAQIEVAEVGRPIREIKTIDVSETADCFDYFAS